MRGVGFGVNESKCDVNPREAILAHELEGNAMLWWGSCDVYHRPHCALLCPTTRTKQAELSTYLYLASYDKKGRPSLEFHLTVFHTDDLPARGHSISVCLSLAYPWISTLNRSSSIAKLEKAVTPSHARSLH